MIDRFHRDQKFSLYVCIHHVWANVKRNFLAINGCDYFCSVHRILIIFLKKRYL